MVEISSTGQMPGDTVHFPPVNDSYTRLDQNLSLNILTNIESSRKQFGGRSGWKIKRTLNVCLKNIWTEHRNHLRFKTQEMTSNTALLDQNFSRPSLGKVEILSHKQYSIQIKLRVVSIAQIVVGLPWKLEGTSSIPSHEFLFFICLIWNWYREKS